MIIAAMININKMPCTFNTQQLQNYHVTSNVDYKICCCGPACYKLLSKHTHNCHYHAADAMMMLPLDLEDESSVDPDDSDTGSNVDEDHPPQDDTSDPLSPGALQDDASSHVSDVEELGSVLAKDSDASSTSITSASIQPKPKCSNHGKFLFCKSDEDDEAICNSLPEIKACLTTWLMQELDLEQHVFNIYV